MSSGGYKGPDLASILRNLASLSPQNQQQQTQLSQASSLDPRLPQNTPHIALQHQQQQLQQQLQQPQAWQHPSQFPPQGSHLTPAPTSVITPKVIDPATIIDWSSGLRCVMKTVAKHEGMLQDIRRMIKVQHEHEEQWWKGREALIVKQKARKEGQKKLDEVLRAVGGAVPTGTSNTSPEELAKELETFDMKVYKAQTQMAREMSAKLRSLGVPFFGTKRELVRIAGSSGSEAGKDQNGMIDEAELVMLQRKMLVILEDMCSD